MTRASGISREEEGQWSGGGEEGSGRLSCILAKRVVWLVRRVEGVG